MSWIIILCHITCLWLSFLDEEETVGGVTRDETAKPLTAVQVCVSTFVSVKQDGILEGEHVVATCVNLTTTDILEETSGKFPAMFMATKTRHVWWEVGTSSAICKATKHIFIRFS